MLVKYNLIFGRKKKYSNYLIKTVTSPITKFNNMLSNNCALDTKFSRL